MAQICLDTEMQTTYQKEVEAVAKKCFTELEVLGPRNCTFCDKSFKNKTKCDLHIKIVHCPKIISCKICQNKCTNELGLRNHMKKHQVLTCKECGKKMNGFNYSSHIRTHLKDVPHYKCDFCNHLFKWKQSLKKHQNVCKSLTVNDGSMLQCSYCPNMFIWKKSLKRHITLKHSNTVENETTVDQNINNIIEKCNHCPKEYKSVKARVKHEKMKHHINTTKVNGTYPCPKCTKMFVWSKSMTRHLNAYH